MGKVKEILKLIKVRFTKRSLGLVWATIIGYLVASRGAPSIINLAYAFLTTFFVGTAIYVYNEVMDYEFDKINKVDRPIATDRVTRKEGLILTLIMLSLGILLSAFVNVETLILSSIFFLLGFLYSTPPIRLKKRLLMKQTITAIGCFISSLIGGTIAGNVSIQVVYAGFVFLMVVFSNSPLVDIADLRGDKAGGVKSITVLYGPRFAIKFAIVIEIAIIVITALIYPYAGFNILTPIIVTLGTLAFIWLAYGLLREFRNVDYCRKLVKKLMASHFLVQSAFILGVLQIA